MFHFMANGLVRKLKNPLSLNDLWCDGDMVTEEWEGTISSFVFPLFSRYCLFISYNMLQSLSTSNEPRETKLSK